MQQSQQKQSSKPALIIGMDKLALKISRVATLLDVSRGFAYGLVNSGKLHAIKIGSEKRVLMSELNRFLEATAEQGTSRP